MADNEAFVGGAMARLLAAARGAMDDAGAAAVEQLKADLSEPSEPQRSRPGEAPHRETGGLQGSVKYTVLDEPAGPDTVGVDVTADAPHAAYLENGTSRMAARPFMAPAADRLAEQIPGQLADGVGRRL